MEAGISPQLQPCCEAFTACIHRGAQQIGGTCIELACEGQRILLDLGLPLDGGEEEPAELIPPAAGLRAQDTRLLTIILCSTLATFVGLGAKALCSSGCWPIRRGQSMQC